MRTHEPGVESPSPPAPGRPRLSRADLIPLALLAGLAVALHGDILDQWWTHEDGLVLLFAIGREPWELLFRPAAWQELSSAGFFPLLPISFRLDYAIAGLSPRFAYGHQLASAFAGVAVLYTYLRGVADRVVSFGAAAAVLGAPLTALIVRQGMVRNYLEGLLLAGAALLFWRRQTRAGAAAAAGFWIAATLCKEAWILLPLFMLADSAARRETWRSIVRRALPLAIAGATYVVWRNWMLGSFGGYRHFPPLDELAQLPSVFWGNITLSTPPFWRAVWGGTVVVLGAVALARMRLRAALITVLAAAAATAPFIPVSSLFFFRYAFVATVALIALSAAASSLLPRAAGWLAIGSILVAALVGGRVVARAENANAHLMATVGRYLFTAPAGAPPLLTTTYGPHVEGIAALRKLLGRGEAPRVFLSNWVFILEEDLPPQVASVGPSGQIVVRPTADHRARIRAALAQFRPGDPLRRRSDQGRNECPVEVRTPGREAVERAHVALV